MSTAGEIIAARHLTEPDLDRAARFKLCADGVNRDRPAVPLDVCKSKVTPETLDPRGLKRLVARGWNLAADEFGESLLRDLALLDVPAVDENHEYTGHPAPKVLLLANPEDLYTDRTWRLGSRRDWTALLFAQAHGSILPKVDNCFIRPPTE